MSHLSHDTLWSLSREELPAAELPAAQAHLAGCADCRVSLDDVKLAQSLLSALPDAPPMPEAMARRVADSLAERADAQLARRFTSWWQGLLTPRFVLAAALGLVLVAAGAWLLAAAEPVHLAPSPVAVETPAPPPVVAPAPAPEVLPAAKKLSVTVASAKKASATKQQVLAEGATVTTQRGGSAWLKLPDGVRAGLTSSSQVTLTTLEDKQLTLELGSGSLALVVPHRDDRLLTVRAGELVVKDLGTRFLVSREPARTLVAVEEGKVEVSTPQGSREVSAGRAVSWSNGQLTELPWEASRPAPAAVEPALERQPDSVARLTEEEEDEGDAPPPAEEAPAPVAPEAPDRTAVAADEQWAQLPQAQQQQLKYPPAPAAPRTSFSSEDCGFSLRNVERKLRELGTVITSPSQREAGARNVALAADANDCQHALRLAERWLREPVTRAANEAQLRRGVQLQQVRCLNHLGRAQEASAVERTIAAP